MNFSWFVDLGNLAHTGNFSQAAELSHISQPAFSRRIKALEEWAGSLLVDRSRQPVALTLAGVQILEAGQQALDRLEQERAQIKEAASSPDRYVVTFGAQHSIGWRFFPAWMQAFEEGFGPVLSRLRADDLPNCVAALKTQEIDFVIAYHSEAAKSQPDLANLMSITIGEDILMPVCRADDHGEPIYHFEAENGPPVPWLRFGEAAPITRHLDPILGQFKIQKKLAVVYENSMAGALRIRARDGLGIAWLPKSLIVPDLESGLLAVTGKPDWQVALQIRLYRLQTHQNAHTQNIWNYLSARREASLMRMI